MIKLLKTIKIKNNDWEEAWCKCGKRLEITPEAKFFKHPYIENIVKNDPTYLCFWNGLQEFKNYMISGHTHVVVFRESEVKKHPRTWKVY